MSRDSRIVYQPGGIFVMVRAELVKLLGFSQSAVVGYLDFLDRAQPREGLPLATRARIIADLQGIVGKNKVDDALAELTRRGWIIKIERRKVDANIMQWFEFSLDAPKINVDLLAARDGRLPSFGTPAFPELGPEPVPVLGLETVPEIRSPKKRDTEGEKDTESASPGVCDFFERLWAAYPRPTGKAAALIEFRKLFAAGASPDDQQSILDGLARWKASQQWHAEAGRYVPALARWLSERLFAERPRPRAGGQMHTSIPAGLRPPGAAPTRLRAEEIL